MSIKILYRDGMRPLADDAILAAVRAAPIALAPLALLLGCYQRWKLTAALQTLRLHGLVRFNRKTRKWEAT